MRKPAAVQRQPALASRPGSATTARSMPAARTLHQRLGNRGTQAFLAQVAGRSSVPAVTAPIQARVAISQPGDPYEQEADRVADAVMRMPASPAGVSGIPAVCAAGPALQRSCAACKTENEPEVSGQVRAHRKEAAGAVPGVMPAVEANVHILQGQGSPLPPATRAFFEPRFGADFSQVRVNTGPQADETARSLGARAFTVGPSISFAAGQFSPTSVEGRHLLAHELTHVVQQDSGIRRTGTAVQRQQATENEPTEDDNRVKLGIGKTARTPRVQAAWYNVKIPFTDYEFDPSLEGLKTAGNLAVSKAKEGATWVKDKVVAAAEWIVEKLTGLINSGIEWLTGKFNEIQDFAVSSFTDIRGAVSSALEAITSPLGLIKNAFGLMDAGMLSGAWKVLKAGATTAWKAVKAVVNGVLKFGGGIWATVSGFVNSLFSAADSLLDSTAYGLLPNVVQAPIKGIYQEVRDLWISIRDFWTDFWQRLTSFVNEVLASIEAFVGNLVSYAIDKVVETVKKLKEVYDVVQRIVTDPDSVIDPIIAGVAGKIKAEAPGEAQEFAQQKMKEASASSQSSKSSSTVVHRSPDSAAPQRSTTTRDEVNENLDRELFAQFAALQVRKMLRDTVVTLFYPPATIKAIGAEFYELWNTDWKNAAGSLFTPRSMFDDFSGFLHDVWSNFLILLDFPLALWQRLNNILMLLMGYVTIILTLIGIGGGAFFGGAAGAWEGAKAGAALAWAIGEALFLSFVAAESVTVLKALIDLYTARQTGSEKQRDYLQIVASVIGVGIGIVIALVFMLLGAFVRAVVGRIKGAPPKLAAPPEPKQLPPGPPAPKQLPPGPPPGTEAAATRTRGTEAAAGRASESWICERDWRPVQP